MVFIVKVVTGESGGAAFYKNARRCSRVDSGIVPWALAHQWPAEQGRGTDRVLPGSRTPTSGRPATSTPNGSTRAAGPTNSSGRCSSAGNVTARELIASGRRLHHDAGEVAVVLELEPAETVSVVATECGAGAERWEHPTAKWPRGG
jgi:hypothetical protein